MIVRPLLLYLIANYLIKLKIIALNLMERIRRILMTSTSYLK